MVKKAMAEGDCVRTSEQRLLEGAVVSSVVEEEAAAVAKEEDADAGEAEVKEEEDEDEDEEEEEEQRSKCKNVFQHLSSPRIGELSWPWDMAGMFSI